MQKKNLIIGGIIVLIIIVGAFFILRSPSKKPSTNSQTSNSASSSSTTPPASTKTPTVVLQTKTASGVGQYLADGNGLPLYTYGGDSQNTSNCTGGCLSSWPAYKVIAGLALPTNVSSIKRSDDGSSQYTYKGMPLYYFSGDSAGQVTGDGVSNFHVAKP